MAFEPFVTLSCLHPHTAANEPVTLLQGPVRMPAAGNTEAEGTGALVLRWLPSTGLRLEAELSSAGWNAPHPGARVKAVIADETVETLINSTRFSVKDGVSSSRVSGSVSTFVRGSGENLAHLGFQVVNFSDFITPGPKPALEFGYPPSVAELQWDGWRIRLSAVEHSTDVFKSLEETGGYAFTHMGRLDRTDGSHFSAQDAEGVLDTFNRFLGFARGAASNLAIRWGVDTGGATVWERWGSPVVDPWKGRDTWFDEHHGNLLSEIFPAFAATHANPDRWEALSLALHWYQKSNTRAGGMEGAIILGLTSLDLLGALVVVDKTGTMGASKYDNLKAAEKLRLLLTILKADAVFPARSANLAAFAAKQGWTDSAEALAEIRHGYVHANPKRRKVVLSASNLATFEAWQLSLWYQELALLYLVDHNGEYRNRMAAEAVGEVDKTPWQ
jgi:hypothetical protein